MSVTQLDSASTSIISSYAPRPGEEAAVATRLASHLPSVEEHGSSVL